LIFVLVDHGKPFDPDTVPTPDINSSFEDRQGGGLGIYMMKKLMDTVSYTFGDDGNMLTLRKRFAEAEVVDLQRFVVAGRLDARGTLSALTAVNSAVGAGARMLMLDMQQVSFLSSSGLRALLLIRREINERRGVLMLVDLQPQVEEVFTMTGFAQIFEIYRTSNDALTALQARGDQG
jgi:anti-anti-sigma factor